MSTGIAQKDTWLLFCVVWKFAFKNVVPSLCTWINHHSETLNTESRSVAERLLRFPLSLFHEDVT